MNISDVNMPSHNGNGFVQPIGSYAIEGIRFIMQFAWLRFIWGSVASDSNLHSNRQCGRDLVLESIRH